MLNRLSSACFLPLLFAALLAAACSSAAPAASTGDADPAESAENEEEVLAQPVANPEAAALAFKRYYRERVERAVVAFNRFQLFGDTGFGVTIGKAGVARAGEEWEIVPGPNDNNSIGFSAWTVWHAYQVFRSRPLALSLVRFFNGLTFLAEVTGRPGVTSRHAYPGWTMTIDGGSQSASRTRAGAAAEPVAPIDAALEREIIAAFFPAGRFTYREEPPDFMFAYMPAVEPGPYSVTYSFSMLPRYVRVSDCCATLMRTPDPYPWAGAFWSNHNSRDNFPDLSMGFLAAFAARNDPLAAPEVRESAKRAWEAAHTVGDLVWASGGRLMTMDETHPYGDLIVAGAARPDGTTEVEDLGSMGDCGMAYLAQAIATDGLALPLPALPIPGSLERLMTGILQECAVPAETRQCRALDEAYCGKNWSNLGELHFFGHPWLDYAMEVDKKNPGSAKTLIGSFQDDFSELTLAMLGVLYYAQTRGDAELAAGAARALGDLTALMRRFADIIYQRAYPEQWKARYHEAALYDAWGRLPPTPDDLGDFTREEGQIAGLESWLKLPDTAPWPLVSDDDLQKRAEQELSGENDVVTARYRDNYGDAPPVRRAGEGYEARSYNPAGGLSPWKAVERPRHKIIGGIHLLEALPLCLTAPGVLDCAWARLGCERPDLDADGKVDAADLAKFNGLQETHAGVPCDSRNAWCGGADLDRTGLVDAADEAFMAAAQGCWWK